MKDKTKKRTVHIMSIVLHLFILIAILFLAKTVYDGYKNNTETFLFGYKPVVIMTEKMSPRLDKYDIVIVKKTSIDEIKRGSYVYFKATEFDASIERVVKKTEHGLVTKKEAYRRNSPLVVEQDMVLGVGLYVISTGYMIQHPILSIFCLGGILLIAVLLDALIKYKRDNRRKKENELN